MIHLMNGTRMSSGVVGGLMRPASVNLMGFMETGINSSFGPGVPNQRQITAGDEPAFRLKPCVSFRIGDSQPKSAGGHSLWPPYEANFLG